MGENTLISQNDFHGADLYNRYSSSTSKNTNHVIFGKLGKAIIPNLEIHFFYDTRK